MNIEDIKALTRSVHNQIKGKDKVGYSALLQAMTKSITGMSTQAVHASKRAAKEVHATRLEEAPRAQMSDAPDSRKASAWDDDSIQFPRLLAEIVATQDNLDMASLAESMDLSESEVDQIFDRAQAAWEIIKDRSVRGAQAHDLAAQSGDASGESYAGHCAKITGLCAYVIVAQEDQESALAGKKPGNLPVRVMFSSEEEMEAYRSGLCDVLEDQHDELTSCFVGADRPNVAHYAIGYGVDTEVHFDTRQEAEAFVDGLETAEGWQEPMFVTQEDPLFAVIEKFKD